MVAARGLLGLAVIFCVLAGAVAAAKLLGLAVEAATTFPQAATGATGGTVDYLMSSIGVVPALAVIALTVASTGWVAVRGAASHPRASRLAMALLALETFALGTARIPAIVSYRMSPEAAAAPGIRASHAIACRKDFADAETGPVGPRNGYRMMECKPVLPQDAVDRYCGEAVSRGGAFRDGNEQVACHAEAVRIAGHTLTGPLTSARIDDIERAWAKDRARLHGY